MARKGPTSTVPGFRVICSYHGVDEYELVWNGLRVLVAHLEGPPVMGLMVTYLVGSRHEATGYTGATHLLEHLMFKGSKKYPKVRGVSVIDRLEEKGARMNATTWLDRTNYYEVLPEEHFEFAVMLEADRMRHALITERDRREEMPAVRSEYAMGENDALEALDKAMWATAFQAHPYHHSTIGWLSDIERVPLERLRLFYDTYYWPNNAYVTVVGGLPTCEVLTIVKKYFGAHTCSPHPIPKPYTVEPEQNGKRFVEVQRSGTKNYVGVAWKSPHALSPDTPALLVLMDVLANGETSRLHRALVEKGLAQSVSSHTFPFHDPSLALIYSALTPKIPHAKVEQVVIREVERIHAHGITHDELTRSLALLETAHATARDGHFALLATLNEAIAVGDWRLFFDLPTLVRKVTLADVQRVGTTYLTPSHLTVGHYKGI